jgi:hypothetical protein
VAASEQTRLRRLRCLLRGLRCLLRGLHRLLRCLHRLLRCLLHSLHANPRHHLAEQNGLGLVVVSLRGLSETSHTRGRQPVLWADHLV